MGVAASQSQPSLGCCPSVCTRTQSEYRPTSVPPTSLCDVCCPKFRHASCVAKVAPLEPNADLHCSPVVYGLGWSICLSRFARGRVPSCVRPSVDVSNFLCVDDVQPMVHSLLLRQCHDLDPRGPTPVVGPLPVHERTAIQIIVDSATARRRPADGARRRTLEELETIGNHTLCGQARKQRSR